MTSFKTIIDALNSLLSSSLSGVTVLINVDTPEKIPSGGLVIVRDGDPGEPEEVLGGFRSCYYTHQIEVEIFCQLGNVIERDEAYDNLIEQIGAAIESDRSLGGLCQNMTYGYPQPNTNDVTGAAGIKSAVLNIVVEYETATPLS